VRWATDLTGSVAALLLASLIAAGQQVAYVPGPMPGFRRCEPGLVPGSGA